MKNIYRDKDPEKKSVTDDDFFEEQQQFQAKYEKELKHYGMLSKPADSRKYAVAVVCIIVKNFFKF